MSVTNQENILSIIDGATDQQRLVIVHRNVPSETLTLGVRPFCEQIQIQAIRERPIVLRQESFSPAVGWFVQSEMELTMDQWSAMRTTVVPTGGASSSQRSRQRASFRPHNCDVISLPLSADRAMPA